MNKGYLILGIVFCISVSTFGQRTNNYLSFRTVEDLYAHFKVRPPGSVPLIQGHRGTSETAFPEGTIASFQALLDEAGCSIEIDPRLTKDSVIVVFHDESIDRNTDGKGKLIDYTWDELQKFRLKGPDGKLTDYKIELLSDVLDWAKDKTVLLLDHKNVPPQMIADMIEEKNASRYVLNTVWSLGEALTYHQADSTRMFLVSIRSAEPVREYLEAGIHPRQLIGSLGTTWNEKARAHLDELKSLGISSLLAAASTYDKIEDAEERKQAYLMLRDQGIDIIESDYPIRVSQIINEQNNKTR